MTSDDYPPLRFSGRKQRLKVPVDNNGTAEFLAPYIPDDNLIQAANLALLLQKPLLLLGEPGCGKSLFAKAVAYDLYGKNMYRFYSEWFVKSTSKAKEGLYEFDQIHRLRDATMPGANVTDVKKYIHLGPMGKAFEGSVAPDKRFVLLIDEIDKADIDFPNDLLNELDKMEFEIAELKVEEDSKKGAGEKVENKSLVKALFRPVVIVTSNSEKDLPDAFLRRCLFHYIEPLEEDKLKEIILGRYYKIEKQNEKKQKPVSKADEELMEKALKTFISLRNIIKTELLAIGKNVSTSEFLDWFEALKYFSAIKSVRNPKEVQSLVAELANLNPAELKRIPYNHILLKNINSVLRFNEQKPA